MNLQIGDTGAGGEEATVDFYREKIEKLLAHDKKIHDYFLNDDSKFVALGSVFEKFVEIARPLESLSKEVIVEIHGKKVKLESDDEIKSYLGNYLRYLGSDPIKVFQEYFTRVNNEYRNRLEGYLKEIKPHFDQADALVVITARNEIDIETAIQAIKINNSTNCHFLIFNNYSEDDEKNGNLETVQKFLDKIKENPDISIVSDRLPNFSNTGFAKRAANDIALFAMLSREKTMPLFGIDADNVGFDSKGFVDKSIALLQQENGPLATSTFYDYDPAAKTKFPRFGMRSNLMAYINKTIINKTKLQGDRIVGAAYGILPQTYALMGGFDPFLGEDIELTRRLRDYVSMFQYRNNPVLSLDMTLYVNPSKEIQNILNDQEPEREWLSSDKAIRTNNSLRFNWKDLKDGTHKGLHNPIAFEVINEVYLFYNKVYDALASNPVYRESMDQIILEAIELQNLSNYEIELSNGAILKSKKDISEFLNRYSRGNTVDKIRKLSEEKNRELWAIKDIRAQTEKESTMGRELSNAKGIPFINGLRTLIARAMSGLKQTEQ